VKNKWTTSQKLQFAAFAVAATRFMAMGAMALGTDLVNMVIWSFRPFFWLEVFSWLGFAALEGYALPYISKGTRKFEKGTSERRQLAAYRFILLAAIPLLGAPYYVSVSSGMDMIEVLGGLYWLWAFLFAGVGALIIDAVGTVETVNEPETINVQPEIVDAEYRSISDQKARAALALMEQGAMDPVALAEYAGVPLEIAVTTTQELSKVVTVGATKQRGKK
jgi:hypothetical protein